MGWEETNLSRLRPTLNNGLYALRRKGEDHLLILNRKVVKTPYVQILRRAKGTEIIPSTLKNGYIFTRKKKTL